MFGIWDSLSGIRNYLLDPLNLVNMISRAACALAGFGAGAYVASTATASADGFLGFGGSSSSPKKSIVSTSNAPNAIGPYSQAVKAGDFLFVSGCIGFCPETNTLVKGGVRAETEQALQNLSAILKEGGSDVSEVCKTTVLLNDMKDYKAVNEVYAKYFMEGKPARAAFACRELPGGASVEIDATAICKR